MEGVLLDTERLAQDSFSCASEDLGLDPRDARLFFVGLVGMFSAESEARLRQYLPSYITPPEVEERWQHH